MTKSTLDMSREQAQAAPADLRRASRILAAVVLPLGPAAVALLRFVLPYKTTDSSTEIVHRIAAHQDRGSVVVWLGLVATLTLVPAVIWVGRVTARRAPRLTAAALLLLVPAYLSLPLVVSSDAAALFGVKHDLPTPVVADMYTSTHPAMIVAGVVFVIGHVLGTILLGVALLRSGAIPPWAAWVTIIAQPLHFVAAVIVGSHLLDLVAWGLNAVGFAVVSLAILRMSDESWSPR
ncbi:hypothetical protein [Nocardioides marmorisolisilvae]|uniref:DUF4386 family protein n=1 Tax=Nocardioides marmorisolisilvae TaxID=1542737 RepID=A0A3N0DQJ3_9ACTN|nr:hypothetical protein [Nocardioides marmorisolisilvae]RNL77736.1 hypothetical protein EFL95_17215 [Nocardioides marmorisolisilvae]